MLFLYLHKEKYWIENPPVSRFGGICFSKNDAEQFGKSIQRISFDNKYKEVYQRSSNLWL
jgi:hypothetical protein